MCTPIDSSEKDFLCLLFRSVYPSWNEQQIERGTERTLFGAEVLRNLGVSVTIVETGREKINVGAENFMRGTFISSEVQLRAWAKDYYPKEFQHKAVEEFVGGVGVCLLLSTRLEVYFSNDLDRGIHESVLHTVL